MNEPLHLTLLGSPRMRLGGQPLTDFATNKAQALLFYLVVTPLNGHSPHSREVLANLLWDGMSDTQAKKNLRTILPDLRRLLGDYVQIERQTVAFDHTRPYWLDVAVLRRDLMPGQPPVERAVRQAAVDLYQGEFLHGFSVRDAPLFDDWVLEQREQLHTLVVNALTALVGDYAQSGDVAAALSTNRRLLLLEPWSEPVHRQQMVLLAQTGDRAAALAQYETCRRVLADEFAIEPLAETTALYEQIRAGVWTSKGEKETGQPSLVIGQPPITVSPVEQSQQERSVEEYEPRTDTSAPVQVTGYNLPLRTKLFGRQAELASLQKSVIQDGCHLVGIFGIGGQGKTALAATFVRGLTEASGQPGGDFRHIIWQTLSNAPPLSEVLHEWIYLLSEQTVTSLPASLDQQFSLLLDYLQRHRCLLVLDNLESILQSDEFSGYFRPGFEGYGQLLRLLVEGKHRSCLLLTSRERPPELVSWEEDNPVVYSLALSGLPAEAGRQLLQGRGLADKATGLGALVQHYSGNPLALKLVAQTVQEIFDGDIAAFLQAETLVFDDIRHVLEQQFARLTPLESELMRWLAIVREPIPFNALRKLLTQPPASHLILEAMRSLQRRSLIEKFEEGFGLQNVVLEYTTNRLIQEIVSELLDDKITSDKVTELVAVTLSPPHPGTLSGQALSPINRHALILAQAKEYVRASQMRLLLQPVAERLLAQLGSRGVTQQLQSQLIRLRAAPPMPGYAAANLLHLLLRLGVDLRGADFSELYLRQLCLRGVSLPQTNFAQAEIVDSTFSEPFGLVYAVAVSPDGQYLAAGMSEGAIYLWRTADQQLLQVLQRSTQAIRQLVFAQPTRATADTHYVLTSISDDRSIGVWS